MWKKKSCYIRCAQCECKVSKWASSETVLQARWSAVQRECKTQIMHFLLGVKIIKDSESTGDSRLEGFFNPPDIKGVYLSSGLPWGELLLPLLLGVDVLNCLIDLRLSPCALTSPPLLSTTKFQSRQLPDVVWVLLYPG